MKHQVLKSLGTFVCIFLILCLGLQRCQAPEVRGNPQFTLLEGCIVLIVLIVVGVVVIKGLLTMCHLIPPPDPPPTNAPPNIPWTNVPALYLPPVSDGTPVQLQASEGGAFASALRFKIADQGSNAVLTVFDAAGKPLSTNTVTLASYQSNRWGTTTVTLAGPVKPCQLFRLATP